MKKLFVYSKLSTHFSFVMILIFISAASGFFTIILPMLGTVLADSVIATVPMFHPPCCISFNPDNNKLYVSLTNNAFLSVIDGSTNTVVGNIPTPFPMGSAFSPVDHMIYVTNYWNGTVTKVDPFTDTVVGTIPLGNSRTYPMFITVNTFNGMLYVGTNSGSVYVVNPFTSSVVTTIPVIFPAGGMAFNPFNRMVYVTLPQNSPSDRVAVIDTSTNSLVANIPIEPAPFGVTVNPSNGMVYVASEHAAVTVITSSNTVVATVTPPTVGSEVLHPHGITFNSDNGKVYVTGMTGSLHDYVFAIDSTNSISGSPIQVGRVSHEIDYDSINKNLYVTHWGSDSVSVISTSPTLPQQPSVACPESNIQHWDKIEFSIVSTTLAQRLNLSANSELDIKVLDDPHKVADLKQKVLNFLLVPNAPKSAIKIIDVEYAIICGTSLPSNPPGVFGSLPTQNTLIGTINATMTYTTNATTTNTTNATTTNTTNATTTNAQLHDGNVIRMYDLQVQDVNWLELRSRYP